MNRLINKLGSIRAMGLLIMLLALCAAVFVQPGDADFKRLFELALTFLLGNYSGRPSNTPNPTPSIGAKAS